ncbi:MAG TPA: hypothetical protein VM432_03870 [Bdellovibrionales bacterium]|nr:hypothetical protein [Bdellovibrionales bacterium]
MTAEHGSTSSKQLRDLPRLLRIFLKDPIGMMKSPVSISYPAILSLIAGTALISGSLVGLLNRNFVDFLIGVLVFPITSVVMALVFSFFIYYFFSIFQSTLLDFRRLLSMVSLALVPFFLFHSASGYLPPIDLIGFAFTGMLLVVGLIEQFKLNRKLVIRLIAGVGVTFFIIWSIAQIRSGLRGAEDIRAPRSLDEMQRSLKD